MTERLAAQTDSSPAPTSYFTQEEEEEEGVGGGAVGCPIIKGLPGTTDLWDGSASVKGLFLSDHLASERSNLRFLFTNLLWNIVNL